jgi:apolipoprotein N-acyltransferase
VNAPGPAAEPAQAQASPPPRPVRRRAVAAAGAGALAALGQAPFDLWPATALGLAALLWLCARATRPRAAAWIAWAGAAAYFAVALHWLVEPFLVDAARHGWMAPFALAGMAGGLALFWAVAAWIAARTIPHDAQAARLVGLAALLAAAEVARGTVLSGLPWAQPGHALIDTPALWPLAAQAGAYGLTLAMLLAAAGLALLAGAGARGGWPRRLGLAAVLALPLGAGLLWPTPPAPAPPPEAPVVRLIQPNAPQHLKWRPDMIPVFFQRGLDLTAAPAPQPPDLVLWPETSLPVLLGRSDAARARLAAAAGPAAVLIGAQRFADGHPRNSVAHLAPGGAVAGVYDKHRLVPFGEYVPLGAVTERWGLSGLAAVLAGGYRPGPGPAVFDLGPRLGRAFPMICYEAIFPRYIAQVPRPAWMAHLTNDAWFGAFSGPYQHLALARLRAAEQGLPVLRAANTGVSAVIDARGRVLAHLPLGAAGHLDSPLPSPAAPTLYARWGDIPALAVMLLLSSGAWLAARRRAPLRSRE